ncbi:MAG TPA: 3-dehydroquinate synthase, partial [Microlunatus sp.]
MNAPNFTITVQTERPYEVRIGEGVIEAVPDLVRGSQRVAILHPQSCMDLVSGLERRLINEGYDVVRLPVPDAEEAKTAQVLAYCWASLGKAGFTRSDSVLGVGGG